MTTMGLDMSDLKIVDGATVCPRCESSESLKVIGSRMVKLYVPRCTGLLHKVITYYSCDCLAVDDRLLEMEINSGDMSWRYVTD